MKKLKADSALSKTFEAMIEKAEDEIDLKAYYDRKNEKTISLAEVLNSRRQKKPKEIP